MDKAGEKKINIIVPDVSLFPGHIACSSDTKSEIVIPRIIEDKVIFLLDIDSDILNFFDEIDAYYLPKLITLI